MNDLNFKSSFDSISVHLIILISTCILKKTLLLNHNNASGLVSKALFYVEIAIDKSKALKFLVNCDSQSRHVKGTAIHCYVHSLQIDVYCTQKIVIPEISRWINAPIIIAEMN